ncbi:hypothetical protein Nepgr_018505 [Nepenthes gracilis]|uniref:Uncharacterized protein n=1 Tax=Nepenthes gracilis TaxID=150966 RepID=A0AAD3XU31_NEPGR|nr:hypothetical protein Nepgr_018505 [Nepenthes gracilis]
MSKKAIEVESSKRTVAVVEVVAVKFAEAAAAIPRRCYSSHRKLAISRRLRRMSSDVKVWIPFVLRRIYSYISGKGDCSENVRTSYFPTRLCLHTYRDRIYVGAIKEDVSDEIEEDPTDGKMKWEMGQIYEAFVV